MNNLSNHATKIILLALLGFSLWSSVYALQLDYPDWFLKETRGKMAAGEISLATLVKDIFNVFLVIAGVAAFIMIVTGGFNYLTSAGNPSKMADAKSQLFNALLGLVLLLGSYLILNTINPELVALKEPTLTGLGTPQWLPGGPPASNKIVLEVIEPGSYRKEFDALPAAGGEWKHSFGPADCFKLAITPQKLSFTVGWSILSHTEEKDISSDIAGHGGQVKIDKQLSMDWLNKIPEIGPYLSGGKIPVKITLSFPSRPATQEDVATLFNSPDWGFSGGETGRIYLKSAEKRDTLAIANNTVNSLAIKSGYALKVQSKPKEGKWVSVCFNTCYANLSQCSLGGDYDTGEGDFWWADNFKKVEVIPAGQCTDPRRTYLNEQGKDPQPRWQPSETNSKCPPLNPGALSADALASFNGLLQNGFCQ